MTKNERAVFDIAGEFLSAHDDPPIAGTADGQAWWDKAAADYTALNTSDMFGHPLMTALLPAIYEYIENKAKAKERRHVQER